MEASAARPGKGAVVTAAAALAVAVLLPVAATAAWLNPVYGAQPPDVVAGVWIFKVTLAALAVVAFALLRVPSVEHSRTDRSNVDSRTLALLAGVLVLAMALRLYRVGTELWLDEIFLRTRYVPLELPQLISTYDSQNHQPFYSILAQISFKALGGTDWSLRIPAILFGVGSLAAVWSFARRVTSGAEALLAALILAVSYHHVWFSQNARGYTTMMFLAVVASGLFIRICENDVHSRRLAWLYAVVMALATYTHLTAAFIAIGHALALVFTTRWSTTSDRRRALWPSIALALSALVTVTLYAPMLPQVVRQLTRPTMEGVAVEWTGIGWMAREAVRVLSAGVPGGILTVAVALSVLAVGVVSYWRRSRLATLVMFLPVALTLAAIIASGHNLWPRYFFFASGFFVLAALRGGFALVTAMIRWHPERVAVAGASAVALLSLATVPTAWAPKQQFRAVYDFVEEQRQPGDAVVALDAAAEIYELRGWAPGWRLTRIPVDLEQLERSAPRTWIVFTLGVRLQAIAPEMYERLSTSRYQVVRVFPSTVGGGEIHVLRHDSTPGND